MDAASKGTLNLSSDGSFTYEPDPDFYGSDHFTYKATTAGATSELAQVQLIVIRPPASLPFIEPFDALTDGPLTDQNYWVV